MIFLPKSAQHFGHSRGSSTRLVQRFGQLTAIVLLATTFATGCSRDSSDLQRYVEEVKARPGAGIEPIPSLRPQVSFVYPGHQRSPFDSSVIAQPVAEPEGIAGTVDIDFDRPREFLEQFPLDALAMVGSLEQDGGRFALVRTPDRTVQRVRVGNWMGQNFGRIVAITPNSIELVEVVPDAFGGYQERDNTIRLID
ncbi:MAG: pilus assembly protein PilP [Thioalkalivibrionaceae bacterium]